MNQAKKRRMSPLMLIGGLCVCALQVGCSAANRQAPQPFQPQQFQSRSFQVPFQSPNQFFSQVRNQAHNVQGQMVQAGQQFQSNLQQFAPQQAYSNWGQGFQQQQANYPSYPLQHGSQSITQLGAPQSFLPSFDMDRLRNTFHASQLSGQIGPKLPTPLGPQGFAGVRC